MKLLGTFREKFGNQLCFLLARHTVQPNEDDPGGDTTLLKDDSAKILVCGEKNGIMIICQFEYLTVRDGRSHLSDVPNFDPWLT